MRESLGCHSGVRDVRETTYKARPTRAMELQPQNNVLVWIGRMRPKDSQDTAMKSGQFNFRAAIKPNAFPINNQTVADKR
jgi:hypothetical protein